MIVLMSLVLGNGLLGSSDGGLEGRVAVEVVDDLLGRVGVEDHADDAAGELVVDSSHPHVEVLTQEILLGLGVAHGRDHLDRDRIGLLLRLGHWHWHWHRRSLSWLGLLGRGGLATKGGEGGLVDSDALLLLRVVGLIAIVLLLRVLLLLGSAVVLSSLVWILLRLVVAVLLIVLPGAATGLAVVALIAGRILS
eukprot:CAMPEP_0185623052 /NCGR_PEP_ID=MMETSP0436-20130131/59609_1 /TAXON_ID=626734 ORGANISM="Favella taraikaensis, Strain Fe Narragansett Bay" /NCGR_SAMPLE_ID=MMETSP0436 /ASSEMBLY_ACC=CAM_ASM_000390 /LENGTH=193 /DNA_ID=CAMNT_0028264945 /DNA_START=301 /DNA_END=883 /DNA_ORIENTATION=-